MNSFRSVTAPHGRAVACRHAGATETVATVSDVATIARTHTDAWLPMTGSIAVPTTRSIAVPTATASPMLGAMGEGCERAMHAGSDRPAHDMDELVEPTLPAGPACHIEFVEEIPTGHATSQALEVTIALEAPRSQGDRTELPALAPLALDAPSSRALVARTAAQLADAAEHVAALLDRVAARVARVHDPHPPEPDELAPSCACSCHAGGLRDGRAATPTRRDELAIRDARDELDVEDALLAWRRGQLYPHSAATTIRAADRQLDALIVERSTLRSLVLELAAPRDPEDAARVVIRGRRGSGRHTTIAALAARIDRRIACIDARQLPYGPGRAVALRRELARAVSAGAIPVISGIEVRDDDEPATVLRVSQIRRAHPGPLVVRTSEGTRVPLPPGYVDVVLAPLSDADRQHAFATVLEREGIPANAELLASLHGIGPGTITRAAIEARRRLDHSDDDPTAIVDAVVRQQIAARIAASATRATRLATWAEVWLPDATLDQVRELIGRARHGRTVMQHWGYDRLATQRRLTALFHGPSGTGKTMIAGLIARELGVELYRVDVLRLISKPPGEIESRLDELFDAAEDGGVMLLFEEVERFAARPGAGSNGDRGAGPALDYLLQRLDAFRGVAVLTTSLDDALDPMVARRLSMRVRFGFPDEELRARLWAAHLTPELPIAGELDLARLARQFPLSGGGIRNSALRAAFLAAQEHSPVTHYHLERAATFELRELGQPAGHRLD